MLLLISTKFNNYMVVSVLTTTTKEGVDKIKFVEAKERVREEGNVGVLSKKSDHSFSSYFLFRWCEISSGTPVENTHVKILRTQTPFILEE